MRFEVSKN